jgi:hypothetical protein
MAYPGIKMEQRDIKMNRPDIKMKYPDAKMEPQDTKMAYPGTQIEHPGIKMEHPDIKMNPGQRGSIRSRCPLCDLGGVYVVKQYGLAPRQAGGTACYGEKLGSDPGN